MRKVFLKAVSLLMVSVMLVGCGTGSKQTTQTDGSGDSTKAEGSGKTEEITVMVWDRGSAAPGTTNEENALTKYIQEEVLKACNVKVNFMATPRTGSDDKVNVMMAGGTAPDVILSYSQTLFGDYATKGGLADLTDAMAEYGSNIQKEMGDLQTVGQVEGKQYAIMSKRNVQLTKHIGYIRKDWLDQLGLEVPKTKEELITCLRAFKEENPGNVKNVVPWAMGGNQDTEKYYLNFVSSYVGEQTPENQYVYSKNFKCLDEGALEGFKVMNELYNEGLITKDFAVDTNDELYIQDLCAGNAGFVVDDNTRPFGWIQTLVGNIPTAKLEAVNCFETSDGSYINPADPLFGMYIMVPKTSENKTAAVMKYLNWLADPNNGVNVAFSPDHKTNEENVPISLTEDELKAAGYPLNLTDYCIANQYFPYNDVKEGVVSSWTMTYPTLEQEFFNTAYDALKEGLYVDPTMPVVLDSESKYFNNLENMLIAYAYKLICCKPAEFDAVQKAEYKKLEEAGLNKILEERQSYYQENLAGK